MKDERAGGADGKGRLGETKSIFEWVNEKEGTRERTRHGKISCMMELTSRARTRVNERGLPCKQGWLTTYDVKTQSCDMRQREWRWRMWGSVRRFC